jgi:hypothetical protein
MILMATSLLLSSPPHEHPHWDTIPRCYLLALFPVPLRWTLLKSKPIRISRALISIVVSRSRKIQGSFVNFVCA